MWVVAAIRRLVGNANVITELHAVRRELYSMKASAEPPRLSVFSGCSPMETRRRIAAEFISGNGIEVGAFANPLPLPDSVGVSYVDKYDLDKLDEGHKVAGLSLADFGVAKEAIVRPDIVDDGEHLLKIGDYSQDFVIANHVLEHFENPIGGFKNMYRVLKHGGLLFVSLPEMRHSFDCVRRETPFPHILRDYIEGPAWSRRQAYVEFAKLFARNGMDKGLFPRRSGPDLDDYELALATELDKADFSIHFHAWTMDGMIEMFMRIKSELNISFETRLIFKNSDEVIFVFEKTVPNVS